MKKIIYSISFVAFTICLNACIETVPLEDLGIKPKLVLCCFLSPQYDTIPVFLCNSQPLFSRGKTISVVTNAVVEISNDNQHWTQLLYDKTSRHYLLIQSQFPVEEGKTYYIRASAPDYESIDASCTVPFWREVELKPDVKFTPSQDMEREGEFEVDFLFSWNDYRGEENYYAAMRYAYSYYEDSIYDRNFDCSSFRDENEAFVVSDAGKDGGKLNLHISPDVGWYFTTTPDTLTFMDNTTQYDSVYILFIQTDRNVCLYENTTANATTMDMLLFMIEPSPIYSNVKNGYGVFGAIRFKSYRLNFRLKTAEEAELPQKIKIEEKDLSRNKINRIIRR
jgi:hypothetical protein